MKKTALSFITCMLLATASYGQTEHYSLYDLVTDELIPYKTVYVERRNISPDCDQRNTSYFHLEPSASRPHTAAINASLTRVFQYYLSDTFVPELQKNYYYVVESFVRCFPDNIGCTNVAKNYVINFNQVNMHISSCSDGMINIVNSLVYQVDNSPFENLRTVRYSETVTVNMRTGAVTRKPSFISPDKQAAFTKLLQKKFGEKINELKVKYGSDIELKYIEPVVKGMEQEEIGYSDYDVAVEEPAEYYDAGPVEVAPIEGEGVRTPYYAPVILPDVANYKEDMQVQLAKMKKGRSDSLLKSLNLGFVELYWENFSLVARLMPGADISSLLNNRMIEVRFPLCDIGPYLDRNGSTSLNKIMGLARFPDKTLPALMKGNPSGPEIPFLSTYNPPDKIRPGIARVESIREQKNGNGGAPRKTKEVYLYNPENGLMTWKLTYNNALDTAPYQKIMYRYDSTMTAVQFITYDQYDNLNGSYSSDKWHDIHRTCAGYSAVQSTTEYNFYILGNRFIREYRGNNSYYEEEENNSSQLNVYRMDSAMNRTEMFVVDANMSVGMQAVGSPGSQQVSYRPVITRFRYDRNNNLLSEDDHTFYTYEKGKNVFIQNSALFQQHSYDKEGRLEEVKIYEGERFARITRLNYNETYGYPDTILFKNIRNSYDDVEYRFSYYNR